MNDGDKSCNKYFSNINPKNPLNNKTLPADKSRKAISLDEFLSNY